MFGFNPWISISFAESNGFLFVLAPQTRKTAISIVKSNDQNTFRNLCGNQWTNNVHSEQYGKNVLNLNPHSHFVAYGGIYTLFIISNMCEYGNQCMPRTTTTTNSTEENVNTNVFYNIYTFGLERSRMDERERVGEGAANALQCECAMFNALYVYLLNVTYQIIWGQSVPHKHSFTHSLSVSTHWIWCVHCTLYTWW